MFSRFLLEHKTVESAGEPVVVSSVAPGVRPLLLAELLRASIRPGLIVCADTASAERMESALKFFAPDLAGRVIRLPDTEILPYDLEDPHPALQSKRIRALYTIATSANPVVICSVQGAIERLLPPVFWSSHRLKIVQGQKLDIDEAVASLGEMGYLIRPVSVFEPGEYARRNEVLDIHPSGDELAYRVRFQSGRVRSIAVIDLGTQRSVRQVECVECLYAREYPLDEASRRRLRHGYRQRFDAHRQDPFYARLRENELPSGVSQYLSLMSSTVSILDYLSPGSCFIIDESSWLESGQYWQELGKRYQDMSFDPFRRVLTPEEVWFEPSHFNEMLKSHAYIVLSESEGAHPVHTEATHLSRQRSTRDTVAMLRPLAEQCSRLLFTLSKPVRRDQIDVIAQFLGFFTEEFSSWEEFQKSDEPCGVVLAPLEEGFIAREHGLLVVTEKEIFGRLLDDETASDRGGRIDLSSVTDLSGMCEGEPVVHEQHGIGRFRGMQELEIAGARRDYVVIEYQDRARKMVSMQDLDLVNRYSGVDPDKAPLHEFNDEQWRKDVISAQRDIVQTARGVLSQAASRKKRKGIRFSPPDAKFRRFVQEFPFRETVDQRRAVDEIISDMMSTQPMDRVVCGDVGFGKTEVAMRAAFLAVRSGHQVCVMVPTAILAQQHFESFVERFSGFGVEVGCINRCESKGEERELLAELAGKRVDIIIGTHRLLSRDVAFSSLGLLVVDEEHRFGVEQKEALRQWRQSLDTLTMSATPIPRTLGMSMSGLREFSIIATPPARRLSIRTIARSYSDTLVKEAVQRERLRHGQIFYLFNDTRRIAQRAEELRELLPDVKIEYVHGKMSESRIEQIMRAFYRHEFDVLVCTTIIEIGIDVPNANTILIDAADRFGVAQLHQLRGRVGRSDKQAYAYLLTHGRISATADKRLRALEATTQLGEGFALAYRDMEVRGAGEILGEGQSGNIQQIGYALYMKLLSRAIDVLGRGRPETEVFASLGRARLELPVSGYLDSQYISDAPTRLSFYKRLMSVATVEGVDEIATEMSDRFGSPPEEAGHFVELSRIRCRLTQAGVQELVLGEKEGYLLFARGRVTPDILEMCASAIGFNAAFVAPAKVVFRRRRLSGESALVRWLVDLTGTVSETLCGKLVA